MIGSKCIIIYFAFIYATFIAKTPGPKSGVTHYTAQIEELQDKDYAIKRVGCLHKVGVNNDMKEKVGSKY